MKKYWKVSNLLVLMLLAFSVVAVIFIFLFKPWPVYVGLLWELGWVGGVLMTRFAYQLATFSNHWHSLWNRSGGPSDDDEPSVFAVFMAKFSGYLLLGLLTIFLFL